MSKFAVFSVQDAIFFVSVVDTMRATIAVTPTTAVYINVSTVKMKLSNAVHGAFLYSHLAQLLKKK